MSIAIHGGIVFPGADLSKAYALTESFTGRIAVLTADELAEFLAGVACRRLDAVCAGAPDNGLSPISTAWDEIDQGRRAERQGLRHPLTDFEFRVELFPCDDGNVYGLVRSERAKWLDEFLALGPAVREFNYWDNTDPPDDVPASEWRSRGRTWERIRRTMMKGRNAGGCAVDLSARLDPPKPEAIVAKLPDFNTRVARTAKDRAFEHFLAHECKSLDPDDRIRAVMRVPDWLATAAGAAWIAAERKRLAGLLLPSVGFEDLRSTSPSAAPAAPGL